MAKKVSNKVTIVREHARHVRISEKNPDGITIVDRHPRRLEGTSLDRLEIDQIFQTYDKKSIPYPTSKKLPEYKNADKYDDLIAVWTDYFNKKLNVNPPLDPDVVKALIASESGFKEDPLDNKIALGIIQITKETFKVLQDPKGEAKDFIFTKIQQKDLRNPSISIPMGIRWIQRKRALAKHKLKREPNHEEIILEYKGMLKSNSPLKKKALQNYRYHYEKLKSL
ncbi:MAG: transglycosylase SLT domain-containing protein [Pseudobdellovibrionaceae bacterium]|jgi:hypothetical protein